MKVAARTEVGPVRGHNEDDLLVDEEHRLFLVADGIGGHPAGDVASRTAVRAAHAALVASSDHEPAEPEGALADALHAAHDAVLEGVEADPATRGMGTTAVVARLSQDDQRLWVAHVGDSRAYLFRAGRLRRLTTDHRIGGGRLIQALGTWGDVSPDTTQVELDAGDRILLCTDGLTDMVDDDDIAGRLASDEPPQRSCDRLVEDAIAHGGIDNITVILIEVDR